MSKIAAGVLRLFPKEFLFDWFVSFLIEIYVKAEFVFRFHMFVFPLFISRKIQKKRKHSTLSLTRTQKLW